jgi:hypothetical protein
MIQLVTQIFSSHLGLTKINVTYGSLFHRTHIVIRMPSKTEALWTNFLVPFSSRLWVAVIGVMGLIAMGLTLTDRDISYCNRNEILKTSTCSYLNSFFCVFGIFCQQGKRTLAEFRFVGKQTRTNSSGRN